MGFLEVAMRKKCRVRPKPFSLSAKERLAFKHPDDEVFQISAKTKREILEFFAGVGRRQKAEEKQRKQNDEIPKFVLMRTELVRIQNALLQIKYRIGEVDAILRKYLG